MKDNITFYNILNIYDKEISKNIKNKKKLYNFDINKMQNISNIMDMLTVGNIGHSSYNIFLIYEPKCRLVMSLSVKDKVINHFVTRYALELKLSKYLDIRNCATRKKMGTHYALNLLIKYLEINKRKYHNFYILKIDIKKYFYSIDHEVLKSLLKDKLDSFEYDLVCKIIDTTNKEYVNEIIDKYKAKYNIDIPYYNKGKGLPIGNMTSQFLSIFYLYELDHYIVHDLKLKYYVRYMDDFIIVSHDLAKLQNAKKRIKEILLEKYKLLIHDKKTMITNVKNKFSFLGYTFQIKNKKTEIRVRKSNIEKIKKRIKKVKYNLKNGYITYNQAFASIMNFTYSYKYGRNERIINLIERYFYNEK